jgi:hypothetical protein
VGVGADAHRARALLRRPRRGRLRQPGGLRARPRRPRTPGNAGPGPRHGRERGIALRPRGPPRDASRAALAHVARARHPPLCGRPRPRLHPRLVPHRHASRGRRPRRAGAGKPDVLPHPEPAQREAGAGFRVRRVRGRRR